MPIIKTDGGYVYKKMSKSTSFQKAKFLFLLFLVCILIFTSCFFIFSKFDITSALSLNRYLIFETKSYYAVCVESSDNFSEVSETAQNVKLQDGAGYVFNINNRYCVIASCYMSKDDAISVAEGINGYSAEVIEIKYDRLITSIKFSSEQIAALKHSLSVVNRAFENLYNVCLSFDRGEILDAEARQKLQLFKEICQEDKESLNKVFQNNFESLVTRVKIFQSEVISNISMLLISKNLSCDIKYSMVSILDSFLALQKNIKK